MDRPNVGTRRGGGEHRLTIAILLTDKPMTVKGAVYGMIQTVTVPLKYSGLIGR